MLEFVATLGISVATHIGMYHLGKRQGRRDISPVHAIGAHLLQRIRRIDVGDTVAVHIRHDQPGRYSMTEQEAP